jgi:Killing trait
MVGENKVDNNKHPVLLFIHALSKATLVGDKLVIDRVAPQLVFSLDNSERITGLVTLDYYLELWKNGKEGFKSLPPQAVLSFVDHDVLTNIEMELYSPEIKGDQLSYQFKQRSDECPDVVEQASLCIDAFPARISGSEQITDSITQINVKVIGESPAVAMGNLFIATSQALGNAARNAIQNQQETGKKAQAATEQGIAVLYAIDTAATGKATEEILGD